MKFDKLRCFDGKSKKLQKPDAGRKYDTGWSASHVKLSEMKPMFTACVSIGTLMTVVFNIVESIVSLRVFFFFTFLDIFGPTSTETVFSKKYSAGAGAGGIIDYGSITIRSMFRSAGDVFIFYSDCRNAGTT